jgi:hypothetical protein
MRLILDSEIEPVGGRAGLGLDRLFENPGGIVGINPSIILIKLSFTSHHLHLAP